MSCSVSYFVMVTRNYTEPKSALRRLQNMDSFFFCFQSILKIIRDNQLEAILFSQRALDIISDIFYCYKWEPVLGPNG